MLSGEKILVTGAAGRVAFPIARALAAANEVWGMARFSDPTDRVKLEAHGIKPLQRDLSESFDALPQDFTYVFHAGAAIGPAAEVDWQYTFEVNAQAVARLMKHCRGAKGFVHCSTGSQYEYQGHRPLKESDPPGIHVHVYSLSKIAAEALAQFAAREYELPTAIIRICSTYGPTGGAPADRLDAIVAGGEVKLHPDKPNHFNPIYEDDYVEFGIRALSLASLPPLVVNWAGSDTVTAEEYCDYLGRLVGKPVRIKYTDEAYTGLWPDVAYMHEVLGRTKVHWKEGMRRMTAARYPDLPLNDVE